MSVPARPVGAHDLLGPHVADGLAPLQPAEVRAGPHAQRAGGVRVEAPRPVGLDERVAVRLDPVLDRVESEAADKVEGKPLSEVIIEERR